MKRRELIDNGQENEYNIAPFIIKGLRLVRKEV